MTIRRSKGGPSRVIPIGQANTEALLVYLDQRERHPLARTTDRWLGNRNQQFGREGLSRALPPPCHTCRSTGLSTVPALRHTTGSPPAARAARPSGRP
ncbi:MAG: hypothetical protein ACRCYU_07750 [Nocardioides sp.]